jgi:hypothetical protein
MRMFFEPDDEEGFVSLCELLPGLVQQWSRGWGADADPYVVEQALRYRGKGTVDGRLGM